MNMPRRRHPNQLGGAILPVAPGGEMGAPPAQSRPELRPQTKGSTKGITASAFAWLERCERRLWLDMHGDAAQKAPASPTGQALARAGIAHEHAVGAGANVGAIVERVPADLPPSERRQITDDLMRAGVPVIEQGLLLARIDARYLLIAQPDRLELRDVPSRLGAWSYAPIEIKMKRGSTDDARLQLDVALWLLHTNFGMAAEGELWRGADAEGRPTVEKRAFDPAAIPAALDRLRALHGAPVAPPVWFVEDCGVCPWAAWCLHEAREHDDLARLPGLKRATAEALRAQGTTTVHDLARLSPPAVARLPQAGPKTAPALVHAAGALATGEPFWHAHARDPLPPLGLVFDLETDLGDREPWGWGWATGEDDMTLVLCAGNRDLATLDVDGTTVVIVPARPAAWAAFDAATRRVAGCCAHWGDFDAKVIADKAPPAVRTTLEPRLFDADHAMRERVTPPLERTSGETIGLKGLGTWLGVTWPEGVGSGVAAVDVFERWRAHGDSADLARLVAYQRADLVATLRAWHWLADHCAA